MSPLSRIAEKKINQAITEGILDCKRFKNKPLNLEYDWNIPDDLKMAYKIMKNAGYLPPELETRKEIKRIEELLEKAEDEQSKYLQMKKINTLLRKLDFQRNRPTSISADDKYYSSLVNKITLNSRKKTDDEKDKA